MLIEKLWCRDCGGPLLNTGVQVTLEGHDAFHTDDLRWNNLMLCAACVAPGKGAAPNAGRVQQRLLYHLITNGVARVGYKPSNERWYEPPVHIHQMTLSANTARQYLGAAVRNLNGIYVGSHHRPGPGPQGYLVGHLKTQSAPCRCDMV